MLVLDDLHLIDEVEALDVIADLIGHVPPAVQLAVASRTDPPLPLDRVRCPTQVRRFGIADLRLRECEARALLTGGGVALDDEAFAALMDRTEGWPAGLYLATLRLQAAASEPHEAEAFRGDDRYVTDYLRVEHLAHVPADQMAFLLETSVLDELSAPLCDAVRRRDDSARLLRAIEGSNLFLVPLEGRPDWYRYHHLFADMLRAELERADPAAPDALRRRAKEWCIADGRLEAALDYAPEADLDDRAQLVAALAVPTYQSGRLATVDRWFSAFDEGVLLARYPVLAILGTWLQALAGRPADAMRWAAAAERAEHAGPAPDGSASLASWRAVLLAALCRSGPERQRADAQAALAGLSTTSRWRPTAEFLVGCSYVLEGEPDRAEQLLASAEREAARLHEFDVAGVITGLRALLALDAGDVEAATAAVARGRAIAGPRLGTYCTTVLLLAAGARLAIVRGDIDEARRELVRAQRLRPVVTYALPWLAALGRLELAGAHADLGDVAGARILLRETNEVFDHRPRWACLPVRAAALRVQLGAIGADGTTWGSTLTAAELRLLPLLTTHLTFREIGDRLYVSRNTVKTQAMSVYRKLGASSRSTALDRATELSGLLDATAAFEPAASR